MPELSFAVEDIIADEGAAMPQLALRLRIENSNGQQQIQSVALRCQVQIEASRRRYDAAEQAGLLDLFGEPDHWSRSLRTLLWTHLGTVVPTFTGITEIVLPVPCSFDFNVAATKYFFALAHGEIPLLLQFSGTIFYATDEGRLQVAQIPWSAETRCRLPVEAWRTMMDIYYPNGAWLRLRRDVFERLSQFKAASGLPTWESALERLLLQSKEQVSS
jgi:hypothetical protein